MHDDEEEVDVDARLIEAAIALNDGNMTQYEKLAHNKESAFNTTTRSKEKIK